MSVFSLLFGQFAFLAAFVLIILVLYFFLIRYPTKLKITPDVFSIYYIYGITTIKTKDIQKAVISAQRHFLSDIYPSDQRVAQDVYNSFFKHDWGRYQLELVTSKKRYTILESSKFRDYVWLYESIKKITKNNLIFRDLTDTETKLEF